MADENRITMTDEQRKAQRARNVAIALCLAAFVGILYFATWAKLAANFMANSQ